MRLNKQEPSTANGFYLNGRHYYFWHEIDVQYLSDVIVDLSRRLDALLYDDRYTEKEKQDRRRAIINLMRCAEHNMRLMEVEACGG